MSPHFAHLRRTSFRRCRASLKCSRHSESFSGITRFMPRYSTEAIGLVPHDEGGAGRWHRPAKIHGDACVPDLAALARRVVVGVLAVLPARAVVVDLAAELPHGLDHPRDAMRVALAEVAARGVVRPPPAQLDDAARYVRPALALLA